MSRIARFVQLKDACEKMTPPFLPPDEDISVTEQELLLAALNGCCEAVMTAQNDLKDLTDPRVTLVKTIKERTTRAVNRAQSNRAWAPNFPPVKAAADRLRNMQPVKPRGTPDAGAPEGPALKKGARGSQSYKAIEGYLYKFIGALSKCSGYDTGAPPDIALGGTEGLTALHDSLKEANEAIPDLEVALQEAQEARRSLFESRKPLRDGSASLRDRWSRIKKAVKGQYGTGSAQYALVRRLKF